MRCYLWKELQIHTCVDIDILGYFVNFWWVGGWSSRRHDWTVVLDRVDLRTKDGLFQDLGCLLLKVGTRDTGGCRTWGPSDVLSSWGLSRVSLSVFVPSRSSFTLRVDFTSPCKEKTKTKSKCACLLDGDDSGRRQLCKPNNQWFLWRGGSKSFIWPTLVAFTRQ